jgi:hypothetical protein
MPMAIIVKKRISEVVIFIVFLNCFCKDKYLVKDKCLVMEGIHPVVGVLVWLQCRTET